MVACKNKDNLQLEKIIGKINIFVIIVNSLLFIELENELQEKTKELTILKETLQGADNSFYCSAIGMWSAPVIIHHSLYFIFGGT